MSQTALMKRIQREQLKAVKQAKMIARLTQRNLNRKPATTCDKCGKESDNLQYPTDESNIAITMNARALCPECWRQQP